MVLTMLVVVANTWEHSEKTVFKKTSEVIITRSKWLITLIDMQPYEKLLGQLKTEVYKLDTARTQVTREYLQTPEYHRILYPLAQESLILETMEGYELPFEGIKVVTDQAKEGSITYNGKGIKRVVWYSLRRRSESN